MINFWTTGRFSIIGDEVWFVPLFRNWLCKYSFTSGKTELLLIPDIVKEYAFFDVKEKDEKVYFIPAYADSLRVLNNSQFREVKIEKKEEYTLEKFVGASVKNECIYLLPYQYDAIVKFNTNSNDMKYIPVDGNNMIRDYYEGSKLYYVNNANELWIFDYKTEQLETCKYDADVKYVSICGIGDQKIYIWSESGELFVFNVEEKMICDTGISVEMKIYSSVVVGETIWAFPHEKNDRFFVISKDGTVEVISCEGENAVDWIFNSFSNPQVVGDSIFVMNTEQQCLMQIDVRTRSIKKDYIYVEPDIALISDFWSDKMYHNIIKENEDIFSLHNYIRITSDRNSN